MPSELSVAPAETALGPMLVAVTPRGIAALTSSRDVDRFVAALRRRFPDADPSPDPDAVASAVRWLTAYLAGERRDPARVDLRGIGRWDAAVYEAVRAIPYGTTATYGDVAMAVGSPRAARAVGGALSRCPLFPAVPCHRVVLAADGVSGWGGGDVAVKRRLIALERAS